MVRTGRVYKIVCSQSNDVYVGSTFNTIASRWCGHKSDFMKWQNERSRKVSIFPLFAKYGIDAFKIILIKEYEVEDKEHLHAYEQLWINKTNCVNEKNPFFFKKLQQKKYASENKEKLAEYLKNWYHNNQDKVKASRQKRQAKTNERNKEKVSCACGMLISRRNRAAHRKSNQHIQWEKDQTITQEEVERRQLEHEQKLQARKAKRAEYHKKWREENIEHIKSYASQTIECGCGGVFAKPKQNRHNQSKRHQTWIQSQTS